MDKRRVDQLSIEELEEVLAIKKRQARQQRIERMRSEGRLIDIGEGKPRPGSGKTLITSPQATALATTSHSRGFRRRTVGSILLIVRIIAVIGLVGLGVILVVLIGNVQQTDTNTNAEVVTEQPQPTLVPTIVPTPALQLSQIVLPGGHTPPNQLGGGQFNFEEIPVHLRERIQDQVFLPPDVARPQPNVKTAVRLVIPKINVDQRIVQGIDWEALKLGIGQLPNGVNPGEEGNVVLAGHNDIYGAIFRQLDRLEPGDSFELHTEEGTYTYTVIDQQIVSSNAVHVIDDREGATATLISSYPYQVNTERIVIFADYDEKE